MILACHGCGVTLAPPGPKGGKPRKWCSRSCRYTHSRRVCPSCGGPMSDRRVETCQHCMGPRRAAHADAVRAEAIRKVEALWAEGRTTSQIAAVMGWTPGSARARVSHYRALGAVLPYRRPDAVATARAMVAERVRRQRG